MDDRWRDSYDAWKLASPYDDYQDEPDELEQAQEECRALLEKIRDLNGIISRMASDLAAAEKWARDYQNVHGDFDREPRLPDFMIVF